MADAMVVRREARGAPMAPNGFLFSGRATLTEGPRVSPEIMKQFNSKGKTYLVLLQTSENDLHIAAVYELDRTKLDRSDLTNGQKRLEGADKDHVLLEIGHSAGQNRFLSIKKAFEHTTTGKATGIKYFLGDEQIPQGQVDVLLPTSGGPLVYGRNE